MGGALHSSPHGNYYEIAGAFANSHAEAFCIRVAQEAEAFPELQWRFS